MIDKLRSIGSRIFVNLKGWRTNRKLLCFESDDWGGIHMESRQSLESLRRSGIPVDSSPYNLVDCLECREDLDSLLNTLASFRDKNGRPPIFTCFFVVSNPDFAQIRKSGFTEYHREPFFRSYANAGSQDIISLWKRALDDRLVHPQFHASEHVNVALWMRDLKEDRRDTRRCFDHNFFGQIRSKSAPRFYSATYWAQSTHELEEIKKNMAQGLRLFEQVFGYSSQTFVACNYVLPSEIEAFSAEVGIRGIQTQRGYFAPDKCGAASCNRYRYTGYRNAANQFFAIRNVALEPFMKNSKDWVQEALNDVRIAFKLRRPAVVAIHRANFVAGISPSSRRQSLIALDSFLRQVLNAWPDVEFVSSADLLKLMSTPTCAE